MVAHDYSLPPDDGSVIVRVEQRGSESVLETIVRAVAAAIDVPATELAPLYEQVDPEALATLLERTTTHRSQISVEFVVEGHPVVVSQDGTVRIREV